MGLNQRTLVVDYGIGNLRSVCRALEYCGAEVTLSDNPQQIREADRVVLPGVGAIGDCIHELSTRGLIDALVRFSARERPFLGICVGMQLMLEYSSEFGRHRCLGWIGGEVAAIPTEGAHVSPCKIPHIGWNVIEVPEARSSWSGTILDGIEPGQTVYFVHSFAAMPSSEELRLADTSYVGQKICAAVSSGALSGTQFHPEKSGTVGLQIIKNFISI